jgi:hypothetical protein
MVWVKNPHFELVVDIIHPENRALLRLVVGSSHLHERVTSFDVEHLGLIMQNFQIREFRSPQARGLAWEWAARVVCPGGI